MFHKKAMYSRLSMIVKYDQCTDGYSILLIEYSAKISIDWFLLNQIQINKQMKNLKIPFTSC
jgi:hypothetical protein